MHGWWLLEATWHRLLSGDGGRKVCQKNKHVKIVNTGTTNKKPFRKNWIVRLIHINTIPLYLLCHPWIFLKPLGFFPPLRSCGCRWWVRSEGRLSTSLGITFLKVARLITQSQISEKLVGVWFSTWEFLDWQPKMLTTQQMQPGVDLHLQKRLQHQRLRGQLGWIQKHALRLGRRRADEKWGPN